MAVTRRYECDVCGEEISPGAVLVVRVGTTANRPDECERFDIGPCCWMAGPMLVLRDRAIMRRAEHGQDLDGNPLPEELRADEQEQGQAAARV